MKLILLIAMLAMLTASSASAQTKKKETHSAGSIESQLIELERQLSDALVKQDAVTLDRLRSRDLVFTFPSGTMSDKSKRIAAQKPSEAYADSTNINDLVKVHMYGKTAVVTVLSTWKGKAGTQEYSEQYQATHVWIKQHGRWQLVAAHVSQVKKCLPNVSSDIGWIQSRRSADTPVRTDAASASGQAASKDQAAEAAALRTRVSALRTASSASPTTLIPEPYQTVNDVIQGMQASAPFGNMKYALQIFEVLDNFKMKYEQAAKSQAAHLLF